MEARRALLEELAVTSLFPSYRGKTVLITGNTGFKGAWLSTWAMQLGAKVVGYSKDIPTTPSLFELLQLQRKVVAQYMANVQDYEQLLECIKTHQPDVIFHLAAQPLVGYSIKEPRETFASNVMGTVNIMTAVKEQAPDTPLVVITSDKCYENQEWCWGYRETDVLGGVDPYSASKAAAEIAFASFVRTWPELKAVSARAGNVIGGGDWAQNRIIPDAMKCWIEKRPVEIRQPSATRPWQHVLEPLSGYLLLGEKLLQGESHLHGESFNFGPSKVSEYRVVELLQALQQEWPEYTDIIINAKAGAEAGLLKLSCDKAKAMLNWCQVLEFQETVSYTAHWYWQYLQGEDLNLFTTRQIEDYAKKWLQTNL